MVEVKTQDGQDVDDLSYYGDNLITTTIDIPLGDGTEAVTLDLKDDLPEDPEDVSTLLENEGCSVKFWLLIAQAYVLKNKLSEAYDVIKRAFGVNFSSDDQVLLRIFLIWLYLRYVSMGIDRDSNIVNASRELAQLQGRTELSKILAEGVLALHKQQYEHAYEIFDRLLRVNASNTIALFGKAKILMIRKHYPQALKIYQHILILNPVIKPDPRIGIGICFWKTEDYKMAISSWERALQLDPNSINAKILVNLAQFDKTYTHSLSNEEFVENYEACLKTLKENHELKADNSVILLQLISFFFAKNKFELVKKLSNQLVEKLSKNGPFALSNLSQAIYSQAQFWLARVAYAEGDFTQSQKYFHDSIKSNDNNLVSKLGLGQAQISRNADEEAIITFESILKTNPKCLEVNYSLGMLYSKKTKLREKAILLLEKYLNLSNNIQKFTTNGVVPTETDSLLSKEPVILNTFLTLSKLYESKDFDKSLDYLTKAIEMLNSSSQEIPLEVYNNVGVFHFVKNNLESATSFFKTASAKLEEKSNNDVEGDLIVEDSDNIKKQFGLSITYNLARAQELENEEESIKLYQSILDECPNYFSARLRLLFLNCVSQTKPVDEETKEQIQKLLAENPANLEVRAFYGWFVKRFQKKFHLKSDIESSHNKETLVNYDSHDSYALVSLANLYCQIARDLRAANSKDEEKKNQYYIRSAQLYQKVLSHDPQNVYAAQGIAVILIETKETILGLEIFRKIRDSLNDISIYLNLGHVLLDLKQFTKAIENYEIALIRYTSDKDSRVLSLLGRAWYIRGVSEKNLAFLNKSLEYSEKALAVNNVPALKFNLAYVQFQIAEFVRRQTVDVRTVEEIEAAVVGLNDAIVSLNKLAEDPNPPYPSEDLKSRASMGSTTLLKALDNCLEETREFNSKFEMRLTEAKRLQELEKQKLQKEEEERFRKQREIEEELAKEREKLQEQARQWAEENASRVNVEEDDDKLFDAETAAEKDGEKKKGGKRGGSKKGSRKKKKFINDSDEDEDEKEVNNDEEEEEEETAQGSPNKRKAAKKSETEPKRRKVSTLSEEKVVDSDDDLSALDEDEEDKADEKNGDDEKADEKDDEGEASGDEGDDLF